MLLKAGNPCGDKPIMASELEALWQAIEEGCVELRKTKVGSEEKPEQDRIIDLVDRIRELRKLVRLKAEEILYAQIFFEFANGTPTAQQVLTPENAMRLIQASPWVDKDGTWTWSPMYIYLDLWNGQRWKVFFDEKGHIKY